MQLYPLLTVSVKGGEIMKQILCSGFGMICAAVSSAFGGWDTALITLVICMAADYLSGTMVALVFHKSRKTPSGSYNSAYGLKGLCKKCMMLLFVVVTVQADRLLQVNYLRDAVCMGFCANEMLSIVENLGLAGIPLPEKVRAALEQLHSKEK